MNDRDAVMTAMHMAYFTLTTFALDRKSVV